MARRSGPAPVRSLYPTKHEYDAALKAYLNAATMLHGAVKSALEFATDGASALRCIKMLKEHSDTYQRATFGED